MESVETVTRKFHKRPIEVEAIQFTGENHADIESAFVPQGEETVFSWDSQRIKPRLLIWTPAGTMQANPGDWVLKASNGQYLLPHEPDAFVAEWEEEQ